MHPGHDRDVLGHIHALSRRAHNDNSIVRRRLRPCEQFRDLYRPLTRSHPATPRGYEFIDKVKDLLHKG